MVDRRALGVRLARRSGCRGCDRCRTPSRSPACTAGPSRAGTDRRAASACLPARRRVQAVRLVEREQARSDRPGDRRASSASTSTTASRTTGRRDTSRAARRRTVVPRPSLPSVPSDLVRDQVRAIGVVAPTPARARPRAARTAGRRCSASSARTRAFVVEDLASGTRAAGDTRRPTAARSRVGVSFDLELAARLRRRPRRARRTRRARRPSVTRMRGSRFAADRASTAAKSGIQNVPLNCVDVSCGSYAPSARPRARSTRQRDVERTRGRPGPRRRPRHSTFVRPSASSHVRMTSARGVTVGWRDVDVLETRRSRT